MLASISPLGERARRQHYAITVTAYVVGVDVRGRVAGRAAGRSGRAVGRHPRIDARDRRLGGRRPAVRRARLRVARPRPAPSGERGLARDLPRMGVRHRLRRAARLRRHHDRHRVDHVDRVRVRGRRPALRGGHARRGDVRAGACPARARDSARARSVHPARHAGAARAPAASRRARRDPAPGDDCRGLARRDPVQVA